MSYPYYSSGGYAGPPPSYNPQPITSSIYTSPHPAAGQFMSVLPSVPSTPGIMATNSSGNPYAVPSMVYSSPQPPYSTSNISQPSVFYTQPNNPYHSNAPYATMSVIGAPSVAPQVSHTTSNPLPFLPVAPTAAPTAPPTAYYTVAPSSHTPLKTIPSLPTIFPSAPTSQPKPAATPTVTTPTISNVPVTPIVTPTVTPTAVSKPPPANVYQSAAAKEPVMVPTLKPPAADSHHIARAVSTPAVSPSRPQSKPPASHAPTIAHVSSLDSFDGGVTLSAFAAPAQSSSSQPRPAPPSGKPAMPELLSAVKDLTTYAEQLRQLLSTRYAKLAAGSAAERSAIAELGVNLDQRTRTLSDLQQFFKTDDLQMKFLRSALKGVVTAGTGLVSVARAPHSDPSETAAKVAASNVANHQSALALSVRSVIQACEMLSAKGQQVYLPMDWQPPRAEEAPRRHLPVTPVGVTPHRVVAHFDPKKIDLKRYDVRKVIVIQKFWRAYVVRKRFRQLLLGLKNDKGSELSRRRQRQKVLKEIEETEKNYVTDLGLCVKHFVVPLRQKVAEGKFFDSDSWYQLNDSFKHLEEVYALNGELYDNVKRCMSQVPIGRGLGDAFSKMVPRLQPYSDYINSYDTAVKALDRARKKDSSLGNFLQQCMAQSGARLDIESYLIKPVQRLPRYQLLLKELIKFTGADHSDLPGLSEAVLRIAQRVDGMNKSKRQKDNTEKLGSLQSQVAGLPMDLADAERYYVKEAPLDVLLPGESQSEQMTVLMLSDALLFTTPRSSKERPYQFVDLCHLHDVEIVDRVGGFAIKHSPSQTEWRCTAKNEADRLGWLNDLKQQLELNAIKDMVNCTHHSTTFRVTHATYGKLTDPAKCKDVTRQLQQISAFQGGKGLELKAEPKSKFLGDPAGTLTSKSLHVMYSFNGQDLSVTFQDSDPVSLPQLK